MTTTTTTAGAGAGAAGTTTMSTTIAAVPPKHFASAQVEARPTEAGARGHRPRPPFLAVRQ